MPLCQVFEKWAEGKGWGYLKIWYFYFFVTYIIVRWISLERGRIFWLLYRLTKPMVFLISEVSRGKQIDSSVPLLAFFGANLIQATSDSLCLKFYNGEVYRGSLEFHNSYFDSVGKVSIILRRGIIKLLFFLISGHILPNCVCSPSLYFYFRVCEACLYIRWFRTQIRRVAIY